MLKAIFALFFIAAVVFMTGCATDVTTFYRGNTVDSGLVVSLKPGENFQGRWETFDMIIPYEYSYNKDSQTFQISGVGEMSQHYQLNYGYVDYFRLFLFLLNNEQQVVRTVALPVGLIEVEEKFRFRNTIIVDDNVTAFSFGYSGRAREDESSYSFKELPYQ